MLNITKEQLEHSYVTERKSMKEVASDLGVSVGSIYNYMKKFGIESRPTNTEESRAKISKAHKGRPSKLKGCHLSEETKDKIRKSRIGKYKTPSEFGGHRKRRSDGYISVYCPSHPYATADGYVMEHILIMEKSIGRFITRDEVVHHKNHIRNDNRIENLKLMTFKEHAKLHLLERMKKGKE